MQWSCLNHKMCAYDLQVSQIEINKCHLGRQYIPSKKTVSPLFQKLTVNIEQCLLLWGALCCDADTQVDNNHESHLLLYIGQFNATCFGLTGSHLQKIEAKKELLCKLHNTISHCSFICLGFQLHKISWIYGKTKSVVQKIVICKKQWVGYVFYSQSIGDMFKISSLFVSLYSDLCTM